uniref:TFIIS-type domain-containing protein n=1 Tax=Elaeophora elaphi TaxID=1147741 RepID=A0A0R3RJN8_9BILA
MALTSSSTTIFDLCKDDLSSILQTLKPNIDATTANSMSISELRARITEWLMLNDLSTMHDFKYLENSQQWKVPDRADHCISCGKYTVTSIGSITAKSSTPIIDQPLTSRESLVFVGRSTSLPSSVLQIIDFSKPLNSNVILKTLHDRNGNELITDKKKHGYEYGKDLCSKCAHWTFPNFGCFPNGQKDWNDSKATTVHATTPNFSCFSCKS